MLGAGSVTVEFVAVSVKMIKSLKIKELRTYWNTWGNREQWKVLVRLVCKEVQVDMVALCKRLFHPVGE